MYDVKKTFRASSEEEALDLLCAHGDAVLVAGGTDVMIRLRERKLRSAVLISILDVPTLRGIRLDEAGDLRLGAGCCFTDLTESPLVRECVPMLADACRQVGSPQIRNIATLGGNLCNGAVSADSAPALYALDARLTLRGPQGSRTVPVCGFHTGPGQTVRRRDELLTEIVLPRSAWAGHGGCYLKFGQRRAMEISTLGCAVNVSLTEDRRRLRTAALAFGVAAPTPVRCPETERRIAGAELTPDLLETVRAAVLTELQPRDSWRASRELRVQLIRELSVRALRQAVRNAGGEEF
jgi:xanthine dehydrogenase FAD-binding subunit